MHNNSVEPSPCLVAVCEDMPRKAIDIHLVRLTIQEAVMDWRYFVYSLMRSLKMHMKSATMCFGILLIIKGEVCPFLGEIR